MRTPVVLAIVLLSALVVALPTVLVALTERQPWPRRIRLVRAAYYLELASTGIGALNVIDGTIVDVNLGDRASIIALRTATHAQLRLQLGATASPGDILRLRYWWAEAIPVLLIDDGHDRVGVCGPSGVVKAQRVVVSERA